MPNGILLTLESVDEDQGSLSDYQDIAGVEDYDVRYILIDPTAAANTTGRAATFTKEDLEEMSYDEVIALYNIPE